MPGLLELLLEEVSQQWLIVNEQYPVRLITRLQYRARRDTIGRRYDTSFFEGFCRKVRFLGQNPKIGYQKFNDLQTAKLSKKQLCDRTPRRSSTKSCCTWMPRSCANTSIKSWRRSAKPAKTS